MHTSNDNNSSDEDTNEVQIVSAKEILDAPNSAHDEQSLADDASDATAPAGAATLHQQKIAGKGRQHQIRYDVKFHVPPSKAADKPMIAATKKVFAKAKEMDDSIVVYPWFKSSQSAKVQETRLIPETMGAFKTYFHQANPRPDGGFVYMRVWLGHDKSSTMFQEDLSWWTKQQQYGLYPRSVQAENISVVGWLLYSTRDINCAALQASLEKRFKDKFEVGCRYRMISLGRRGAVPLDQRVKAIHI
jgi:hypothetical protein